MNSTRKSKFTFTLILLIATNILLSCASQETSEKSVSSRFLTEGKTSDNDPEIKISELYVIEQEKDIFEAQPSQRAGYQIIDFIFKNPEDEKNWMKFRMSGDKARNEGDYPKAVEDYTNALSIKPEYITYYNRAISFTALEDLENALADYDNALELQRDFHQGWSNRGSLLSIMYRYGEAISSYEKAISIYPEDFSYWYGLGRSNSCLSKHKNAISSYEKSLSINPESHVVLSAYGISLAALGRHTEAIDSFEKALAKDPENAAYKLNMSVVKSNRHIPIQPSPCIFDSST